MPQFDESMRFDDRARQIEMKLNDTEDEIIDYIRRNRASVADLSIKSLAEILYVAPNAIMRLSKKLGYSGYAELKFALKNEMQQKKKGLESQMIEMLPGNIVRTLDVIDQNEIERAARLIRKASDTIFAGVGDSQYFCELLGKNIKCMDYRVQYYGHIHDMIYAVEHAAPTDVLVVISASGKNERLVNLAKRAREKGMSVISITHLYENPQAAEADIPLYFWGELREVQGYNVTDRTGMMLLVRLLSETIWREYR